MEGEDEPWQFSMFVYADEYDGATAAPVQDPLSDTPGPLEHMQRRFSEANVRAAVAGSGPASRMTTPGGRRPQISRSAADLVRLFPICLMTYPHLPLLGSPPCHGHSGSKLGMELANTPDSRNDDAHVPSTVQSRSVPDLRRATRRPAVQRWRPRSCSVLNRASTGRPEQARTELRVGMAPPFELGTCIPETRAWRSLEEVRLGGLARSIREGQLVLRPRASPYRSLL